MLHLSAHAPWTSLLLQAITTLRGLAWSVGLAGPEGLAFPHPRLTPKGRLAVRWAVAVVICFVIQVLRGVFSWHGATPRTSMASTQVARSSRTHV
jgi:hypothetical protein